MRKGTKIADWKADLRMLKDFQKKTVSYVFRRLYKDSDMVDRFLIADEVGLGKTLVARGIIMIAAKRRGLPVFEYAPTEAKRAVVGNGKASKFQVQGMVQRLLKLAALPQPEDAADALALAICHAQAAAHRKVASEV